MPPAERYALFDKLLRTHRRGVTSERLMEAARCSRTTLWRDLQEMRDTYGAPIKNDGKKPCTWYYDLESPEMGRFQFPGLWLTAKELFAFVLSDQMFGRGSAGSLLGDQLRQLQPRVQKVFGDYVQHLWRIEVQTMLGRAVNDVVFDLAGESLLKRRLLCFQYHGRGKDDITARRVSPQRLRYYRDNWYLEAWDEGADAMRSFAVERILSPALDEHPCRDLSKEELLKLRPPGFGIFAGPPIGIAILVFSVIAARWVADEWWHADQQKRWLDDDRLELRVPYSDTRELVKDIMRHGADVVVIGPPELRREVRAAHKAAVAAYGEEEDDA